ncbi:ATP-binding protein [Streptomyces sp. NPDC005480]|uniref:ATP-binding protein n=1 Tax=Streptomyces sp. NPDC005480 TaxID=3154880 RepID=UPI0033B094FF
MTTSIVGAGNTTQSIATRLHDASPIALRLSPARTIDEGGRGLFIVAELAQNRGVRYTPDGKNVWTEQPLPPQPR